MPSDDSGIDSYQPRALEDSPHLDEGAGTGYPNRNRTPKRHRIVLAVVIGSLAIAQAIEHHTLEPIWLAGWIPAVLVALMRPRTGLAVILAIIVAVMIELTRGHSGPPYTWLDAIAGPLALPSHKPRPTRPGSLGSVGYIRAGASGSSEPDVVI